MSLFRVQSDDRCPQCHRAEFWVIGPDGVAEGVSFDDEEGALEYAAILNRGVEVEQSRVKRELLAAIESQRFDPVAGYAAVKMGRPAMRAQDMLEAVQRACPDYIEEADQGDN